MEELNILVVSLEETVKNLRTVANQLLQNKPDYDNSTQNSVRASPAVLMINQQQEDNMKTKIKYAKFLQDTVKEMANEVQCRTTTREPRHLDHFLDKVRTRDEILGFAKLFNDQHTLRNITRPRLVNMCNYMGIQIQGADTYLRYMLRKRLQRIENDDKMIQSKGGADARSEDQLVEDCRERGMLDLRSVEEMRQQLRDWLDLSLNHSVPSSLMVLSRATLFSLPVDIVENSVSERQRKLEKDVAYEEIINATAAYAQQQLCKVSEAIAILASASSLSREREASLKLVNKEVNLYHSMMDKEGTDVEHALDGASSALINRRVDAMLQKLEQDIGDKQQVLDRTKNDDEMIGSKSGVDALSEGELGEDCRERGTLGLRSVEEIRQQKNPHNSMTEKEGTDILKTCASAREENNDSTIRDEASTTRIHFEKYPMGPTLSSGSAMVLTLEKRRNDQPNVSSGSSSSSNMKMSLVEDYRNKYDYGYFSDDREGNTRITSSVDVALEESINADAQQQAKSLDKQQVLASASASSASVSREREESSVETVKDVPDGASSALINRDYDGRRVASATASTTPAGPTPPSVSNSNNMSLVGNYGNNYKDKYNYGAIAGEDHKNKNAVSPEERPTGISEVHWLDRFLAQEVAIEDIKRSVGSLQETVKNHFTVVLNLLTTKSIPSSDILRACGSSSRVIVEDDHEQEEAHSVGVVQAAESSPPEDEDHCSSVFEPTTSEERPAESVEEEGHTTPVAEAPESSSNVLDYDEEDSEVEEKEDEEEYSEEEVEDSEEEENKDEEEVEDSEEKEDEEVEDSEEEGEEVEDSEEEKEDEEEDSEEEDSEEEVEDSEVEGEEEVEDSEVEEKEDEEEVEKEEEQEEMEDLNIEEPVAEPEPMNIGWNAFLKQHKGENIDKSRLREIWKEQQKYVKKEQKVRFRIQCLPNSFLDPLEELGPERRKLLEDSPFYKLLMMDPNILDKVKVEKYASMFNTEEQCLEFEGSKYFVTPEDFTQIMGVEDREEELSIDGRKITNKLREAPAHIKKLFMGKETARLDMDKVVHQLQTSKNNDNVKRAFALLALRYIIRAPEDGKMPAYFVNLVYDLGRVNKIKWATYAVDCLLDGIKKYKKRSGEVERCLGGCTIFFQLFAEKVIPQENLPSGCHKRLKKKRGKGPSKTRETLGSEETNETLQQLDKSVMDYLERCKKKNLRMCKKNPAKRDLLKHYFSTLESEFKARSTTKNVDESVEGVAGN